MQNQTLLNADLTALNKKGRSFAKLDDGRRVTRAAVQEDLDKVRYRWDNVQQVITEMQNYFVEHSEEEETFSFEDWLYGYLDFVALNAAADKEDGREKDAVTTDAHMQGVGVSHCICHWVVGRKLSALSFVARD